MWLQTGKFWYRAYKIYASAAGIKPKPEDLEFSIFLHVAGAEAQRIHANMHFTASQKDKIEPLVNAFQEYCYGRSNLIIP